MSNPESADHGSVDVQKTKRKNNKANRMKDLLVQELPNCFKQGNEKKPLCIGIHLQIHAHYKDDIRFEPKTLQAGLNRYCAGVKYLRTIVEGASRIDIHGHPVAAVTTEEAAHAQGKLQDIEEQKKKKMAEEQEKKKIAEKTQGNLKNNTLQPPKSIPKPIPKSIPKPIPLDELRNRKNAISQVVESSSLSKEQIKKEKQDKYAKKMARRKI